VGDAVGEGLAYGRRQGGTSKGATMGTYAERLRRIATNNPDQVEVEIGTFASPAGMEERLLTLVRLAALIAVGGSEATFGEQVDAALSAGATTEDIVDVLVAVSSVVGVPRVVSAASRLVLALGVDESGRPG
jgi:alkylhydroperoxidase/carboxymuconolactone decarboxylase family protein YurZ